jgi:hypothetical protein
MRRFLLVLLLSVSVVSSALAAVTLVEGGKAQAVIVIPDKALPVEQYAAAELAYHVAKATGAALATVKETEAPATPATRIYLGNTAEAAKAGLVGNDLAPEEFVIRTMPNALFIVGHDSEGGALDTMTWAGTLFGVYQLLEDNLKARWLWPGELGVVVRKTATLTIPDTNRKLAPRLVQRNMRSSLGMRDAITEGGFTPQALAKATHDEQVFVRRHRQGKSLRLRYGHSFVDWWARYGAEHPDWFQMVDGKRPEPGPRGEMSMCVSNPGFHQQIIDNWLTAWREDPTHNQSINCCENDVYGICSCPTCLSWDVERPDKPISERYEAKCVSDRYARFWLTIQQIAAKYDPNAVVTGYAYVNYALPPLQTKLNEHIYIGMVPDVFFPRTPEEQKWVLNMWAGWRKTGCRMFLRPNYTLEGYCMPYIYTHQYAEEYAFDAKNGMIATDYDSLTGMWATQGPQNYLFARWPNELDAPVDTVLAEYYAGFGPAATQVNAYFDYWEKFTTSHLQQLRDSAKKNGGNWIVFPRMTYDTFTPEAFAGGRKLLDAATRAAANDPDAAARVAFLEKGLTHAGKCAALSAARVKGGFRDLARASADLNAYRTTIAMDNVANLNYCAWQEFRSWGAVRQIAYNGEPLHAVSETVAPAKLTPISTRAAHGFAISLKAGENFKATVQCLQVGKYTAPCRWSLANTEGTVLQEGVVEPGKSANLDIPVPAAGIYSFIEDPGANGGLITLLNDHAALLGGGATLIGVSAPLYVYVPQGTKSFTVTLKSPAPGETAKLTILDPRGQEAASGETGAKTSYVAEIKVPDGMDGKAWGIVIGKASTGVSEDMTLALSDNLPGYWSQAPDRLLSPVP